MSDSVIVVNADVRALERDLVAARFAACIVDPPYSDRVHEKATSNGTAGAGPRARDLGFASLDATTRDAVARIAASCARWSAIFSDIEGAGAWRAAIEAAGAEYIRAVPWVRWSQPQLSGDRPPSGCELVTLAHPLGAKHWNGPGSLTAFDTRSLRGAEKFPCEKPLDLLLAIISWFSDAGETVVDTCAGSGTTGLAARLLGRSAVLVEVDAGACAIARRRVAEPLTDRDRERVERWLAYQCAWLTASEAPTTAAGEARYERAMSDTNRVAAALSGGAS